MYVCLYIFFCFMSNSHQRESSQLSSAVRLRERIQPSMWLCLCSHLRVRALTHKNTLNNHSVCLWRICRPQFKFTVFLFLVSQFLVCVSSSLFPENPTKPWCSVSSKQTWVAYSLALWLTRSSPPAWLSSTATWPRLSSPSRDFDTKTTEIYYLT